MQAIILQIYASNYITNSGVTYNYNFNSIILFKAKHRNN